MDVFVIADIDKPILGVDFIDHYDLLINVKRHCLWDPLTNLTNIEVVHNIVSPCSTVANASCDSYFSELTMEFPNFQKECHGHNVTHLIVTNAPPPYMQKPGIYPLKNSNIRKRSSARWCSWKSFVPLVVNGPHHYIWF